jgi:hypothetical protein
MRRRNIKISLLLAAAAVSFIYLSGCADNPPLTADGECMLEITALGNISLNADAPHYVPMANAEVILSSEYGIIECRTDENGMLNLKNLPSSVYDINIKMRHPENPAILITGDLLKISVTSARIFTDTLFAAQIAGTGIAINEIYAAGPINDFTYYYDQYLELYNYSDETKYLDGMIVCRFHDNKPIGGAGSDEGNDGDIDGITLASKFPGKPGEKNYPFEPHTFKVLAVLAIDHRTRVPSSIDLSTADWEFYNPNKPNDFDNPNVPNIVNIRPDKDYDFNLNLMYDCLILATGEDINFSDGLDISTIIDGVEYRTDVTQRPGLDPRVDKSIIRNTSNFSGQSLQRREPGFDTNNGIMDWEIIPAPTPGRQ